jgi:hypothetical protein
MALIETQIDWCPRSEIERLQGFLERYWSPSHILVRDRAFLSWQFPLSADPDKLSVLVARRGDSWLGLLGVIPADLAHGGERRAGAMLGNWVVTPGERTSGLGLALLSHVLSSPYALIGTLGGNAATLHILRTLRFQIQTRVPRWVGVFSPRALTSLLQAGSADYTPSAIEGWTATALSAGISARPTLEFHPWTDEFAARWNDAWHTVLARLLTGVWRDADYLTWRYIAHPNLQYSVEVVTRPGGAEILGLLAYRLVSFPDRPEKILRIVELLGTTDAQESLARRVVELGHSHEVAFADFYCTSTAAVTGLRAEGFVPEESQAHHLPSLFSPLDFSRSALTSALLLRAPGSLPPPELGLYFTRGDCDQDRPR